MFVHHPLFTREINTEGVVSVGKWREDVFKTKLGADHHIRSCA